MNAYDHVTARLAAHGAVGRNGSWTCPAHDDQQPSLSVTNGNGKVLLHCHAGCTTENVLATLDLDQSDLFDSPTNGDSDHRPEVVASYDYTDENGELLYQVVRYSPKSFRQRRPDGNGWAWKLGDTRRVLYRLPEVLDAVAHGETVFVVEGEKDADRLTTEGYTATTNPGGAGKWRPDYNTALAGGDIVIVADRDQPGYTHARGIAQQLEHVATTIRVVEPATGKDLSDHLAAGQTVEELVVIDPDNPSDDTDQTDNSPFLDWHELFNEQPPDEDWLLQDVFAIGRGHALYAQHKTGKSLFTLWAAAQLATTRDDIDVIYLDYEMTRADIRERLEDMGYGPDSDLSHLHYALLPSMPPLDTEPGMYALLILIGQVQRPGCHILVVIDTTGRATQGPEDKADTFRDMYRWTGTALKRLGVTWVRLDHAGKTPAQGQRGSSGKGDDVDVIWQLQQRQGGIELHRDAARMSWAPEKVTFTLRDNPLRYERTGLLWPAGTAGLAADLDQLGVPLDAGRPAARQTLREAQIPAKNSVLAAALKYRRDRAVNTRSGDNGDSGDSGDSSGTARNPPRGTVPGTAGDNGL